MHASVVMFARANARIHAHTHLTRTQVREYFFFLFPSATRCRITCLECYFHFAVRASLRESGDRSKVQCILQPCVMNPRVPPTELLLAAEIAGFQVSRRHDVALCIARVKCGQ